MVAVPFVYFSFLLIYVLHRKKTFDVSAYLISIYLISAFFSILIDVYGLRSLDTIHYQIGFLPTFLYCALLTIIFYPFIKLPVIENSDNEFLYPRYFNLISYFYIAIFFILLIVSIDIIINIINGDMAQFRKSLSRGEGDELSIFNNVPTYYRFFVLICIVFASVSMIMLLFYFYSICFLRKSKLFNSLLFISSTSILILAIVGVDRSKVIYWALTYGFFILLFWKFMSKKQRKRNMIYSFIFFLFIILYFSTLTIQRFENSEIGTDNSLIIYAGQSFINFCYFFDEHPYQGFTLQKLFPLFHKLFINSGIESTNQINQIMTQKTGIQHGIFNTFMGDILMASNNFTMILYCLFVAFISNSFLSINKKQIDLNYFIILFCFYSIVLLGVFTHFYANYSRVICLLFFMFYIFMNRRRTIPCTRIES